jgi:hypothetical protein
VHSVVDHGYGTGAIFGEMENETGRQA